VAVRHVADDVATRIARNGQVRGDIDATTSTRDRTGSLRNGRAGLTATPDDCPGRDLGPVVEDDTVRCHRRDADAQPDGGTRVDQLGVRIAVGLARELSEERVPAVDEGDLARLGKTTCLVQRQHQLGQRTGRLDAGGAASHHDDVELTRLHRGPVGHGGLKQVLQVDPEPFGVRHGVQREGVLGRARHSEEVGARACGHHDVRALQRRAVVERETA
jgi:hypothetical protein